MSGPDLFDLGDAVRKVWSAFDSINKGADSLGKAIEGERPFLHDQAKSMVEQLNNLAEQLTQVAESGGKFDAPELAVSMDELADPGTRDEALSKMSAYEQSMGEHISSMQDKLDQLASIQQEASTKMDVALDLRDTFGEASGVPFLGFGPEALTYSEDFEVISSGLSNVRDAAQRAQDTIANDLADLVVEHDYLQSNLETLTNGPQEGAAEEPSAEAPVNEPTPWDPAPQSIPLEQLDQDALGVDPNEVETIRPDGTAPWDPLPQSMPPEQSDPDALEADPTLDDYANDLLQPHPEDSQGAPPPDDTASWDPLPQSIPPEPLENEGAENEVLEIPIIKFDETGSMPILQPEDFMENLNKDNEPILSNDELSDLSLADPSEGPTSATSGEVPVDALTSTVPDFGNPFTNSSPSAPSDDLSNADVGVDPAEALDDYANDLLQPHPEDPQGDPPPDERSPDDGAGDLDLPLENEGAEEEVFNTPIIEPDDIGTMPILQPEDFLENLNEGNEPIVASNDELSDPTLADPSDDLTSATPAEDPVDALTGTATDFKDPFHDPSLSAPSDYLGNADVGVDPAEAPDGSGQDGDAGGESPMDAGDFG